MEGIDGRARCLSFKGGDYSIAAQPLSPSQSQNDWEWEWEWKEGKGSARKGQGRRQGGDLTTRYSIHVQTSGNERI